MTDKLDEMINDLRTMRDELRVQIHLGKAEAKEEFEALEKKWHGAEARFAEVTEDAEEAAEEVKEAARIIAEEIGAAYTRIKARLDD